MEEDIKILEELFYDDESFEPNGYVEIFLHKNEQQAIQNLIARYKELEQENQSYKDYYGTPPCYDNAKYILKSKVKEILSICRDGDLYGFKQAYETLRDDLQELLED